MIILAAAIILSLSSSGIIGKANEAKNKSDEANLLEAANLAAAEWELENKLNNNNDDAVGYITDKLTTQGFTEKQITEKLNISEDGKVSLKEDETWDDSQAYLYVIENGVLTGPNTEYCITEGGLSIYADKEHTQAVTDLVFPQGVTSIGNQAFNAWRITSITLPNGVTSIGDSAFCLVGDMVTVTIPNSVTSIGDNAFYDCFELKDVYYKGTQAEWEAITIGSGNEALTSATIHYES